MTGQKGRIRSVCPYCAVGCGLIVDVEDGIARRVRADEDHLSNLGRLCSKGALLPEMLRTDDRLLYPQVRESLDQPFRRVTWSEAIGFAAERMQRIAAADGPDALGFYGSGQLLTEDYYLFSKLAKGFIGTNNQDTNSRLCMTSAGSAYTMAFGQDGPPPAFTDIEQANCFFILGANVEACHPVLFQRIKERKRKNPREVKVIVVDPRRTETASIADLFLPVRPGTDVALLNSMLHELVLDGLVDSAYIEAHTEGWEALRESVRDYTPERIARLCGLEAEAIREAALLYGRAANTLSMWTMGANQSTAGVDKNLALINLALATGNIGRPGAGPFSLTGQPNAMGGREAGCMAHSLPGHRFVTNPEHRAEIEALWGCPSESISARPGLTAVEMFDALADGRLKSMWVAATNPVASMPNVRNVTRGLRRAALVVVQDAYHPTETTEYAHVLLAAAQWSEREGTMTNAERRVCLLEKAGDPPGEALPDWQITCLLARALGHGEAFDYRCTEEIFEEFKRSTAGRDLDMTGMSYARLRNAGGLQWPMPEGKSIGTQRLYAEGSFPTLTGRARFHTVQLRAPSEPADREYPFVLTTGRVKDQWHTRTRTGKIDKLVKGSPAPFIELNAVDAGRLSIRSGDLVKVESRRGTGTLRARVTRNIREGTVFAPIHWAQSHSDDSAVNLITNPAYDPVSKEPELKYTAVRIQRTS